jgi:hypothetical protein
MSITSFPSLENNIWPRLYFAGGDGKSCKNFKDVKVFPEPDSPTIAMVSPRLISKEIFLTADVVPESVMKSTLKSFI